MAEDFDAYIASLKNREAEAKRADSEKNKTGAILNYNDWAWHFEFLKKQFTEAYDLFGELGTTVPNWQREEIYVPSDWRNVRQVTGPIMLDDRCQYYNLGDKLEGYSFETAISRFNSYSEKMDRKITVSAGPIGSERPFFWDEPINLSTLKGLETVNPENLTLSRARVIIKKLTDSRLKFRLEYKGWDVSKSVEYGALYEHDLVDICKDLFVFMSQDEIRLNETVMKGGLERMIPKSSSIRRGNQVNMLVDDNLIVHESDSEWRNE
jgi:hypothetical protein